MRFMVFMIPTRKDYLEGVMPSNEAIAAMTAYNEQLVKAGVMLGGDGLAPPAAGARVAFTTGKGTVVDGPFTETKELIGGYWLWQCKDLEEAIGWARKCPAVQKDQVIEIRRIFGVEDFAPSPEVDRAFALRVASEKKQ